MELHFSPELEGKLAAAASRRGVSAETVAHETLDEGHIADGGHAVDQRSAIAPGKI